MFSPQIIDSDAFLDMPVTAQALYFHLAMRADDDGFVGNPKKIMRMVGSQDDDIKVLIGKRFLLSFQSGVVVIKHWLIHNLIRLDRYHETVYKKEKSLLGVRDNGGYTESEKIDGINVKQICAPEVKKKNLATKCQPNDNQMAPQVRLGKVRLGKVRKIHSSQKYLEKIPYRNYRAFLINALKRDFSEREIPTEKPPDPPPKILTPGEKRKRNEKLNEIRKNLKTKYQI